MQPDRNLFVDWAENYIYRNPGLTAREIVESYLSQGLYSGFAQDPIQSLVATLHLYATRPENYLPSMPVYRNEDDGPPYTFYPAPSHQSGGAHGMNQEYVFTGILVEEDDGRWSASLVEIPWCATFGDSREDALRELRDATRVAVQHLEAEGQEVPAKPPAQELVEIVA